MPVPATFRQLGREWLVALLSYTLLVAPFGCQLQNLLDNSGTGGTTDLQATGIFLNTDITNPLIAAGRDAQGDAFFVYGTRSADSGLQDTQIASILVQTADGQQSFITFDAGRPVHLQGPDGSYVHIKYTEVTEDRLAATVTVHDAASDQTAPPVDVAIDLQQVRQNLMQAAQQGAQAIQALTGQIATVPAAPAVSTAKWQNRAVADILIAIVAVPLALLTQFTFYIVGEMMTAVFDAVAASIQASIEAALQAAFTPLLTLGNVLSQTSYRVEITPLFHVFVHLPPAPIVTIKF